MSGSINAHRTLAAVQVSKMGRYDVLADESLPGFGMGIIVDIFQIAGNRHDDTCYFVG